VPLGRNHARPRRIVQVRPAATWGTAQVRGASAAQLGRPAHGRRRGTGGSTARGRWRGVTVTGERRGGRGGTAAIRATVRSARRSGRQRRERGQVSGRVARCPDSGFKPRRRRGTWQPRGVGALPRGPGTAHGV
jgi:hypothetical protein